MEEIGKPRILARIPNQDDQERQIRYFDSSKSPGPVFCDLMHMYLGNPEFLLHKQKHNLFLLKKYTPWLESSPIAHQAYTCISGFYMHVGVWEISKKGDLQKGRSPKKGDLQKGRSPKREISKKGDLQNGRSPKWEISRKNFHSIHQLHSLGS